MASKDLLNGSHRGMVKRIVDALDREEKGYGTEAESPAPQANRLADGPTEVQINGLVSVPTDDQLDGQSNDRANGTRRTATSLSQPRLLSTHSKLRTFRVLTGIDTPAGLATASLVRRPASNVGIYTRVVNAEARYKREYRFFTLLISCCLGIQVVVAAALTALGAGNGPRVLVTIFGAVNTGIAGYLTYLKGSGLPNRKRYHQSQYAKIRQHIEQRERDFCLENCELDVHEEIRHIQHMYEEVQEDVEANTPESFSGVKRFQANQPVLPLPTIKNEKDGIPGKETLNNGVSIPSPVLKAGTAP
ncbi:conserved hypothetical protein [Trichophyton verrucosum HKI 0517]|uniref:SMODS and SLOG-associating 2TM effector domain-containing protein n=1 Tax=Trichophyton verrucosum (strain HKI 0517) TaxID=663202 RepID=D4DL16_TRIVH|nr:uncharacterized protein TRV_07890 [Trichophyton verrucosum HKI 0517]EFE37454.1 conserved hypothetical protein [Trichophyton verrucosum HKI 0517]